MLLACGPAVGGGAETDANGDTDGSASTSTAGTSGGPSTSTSTSTSSSGDTSESGSGSQGEAEVSEGSGTGSSEECDLWAQDCPPGEKCMPWANDGGNAWNAAKCSSIQRDPDEIGESCTVQESGVSGIDSCEAGSMCFHVDADNEGTCVAFCKGDETNPICDAPDHVCPISGDGILNLCLPTCDPLAPDCAQGDMCIPTHNEWFICAPDVSGDAGADGDPCEFVNVCDPGLVCAPAEVLPDCEASGCCTPYCDLQAPDCAADEVCVPYFEPGNAPPGYENVGICGVAR
jgi:hypothetical protein